MSLSRLVISSIGILVFAACGKGDSPAHADDRAASAARSPTDAAPPAPDPTAALVRDEAAWQALVMDGPGDAFCAKAAVVRGDIAALPDPPGPRRDLLDQASVGFEKVTPDGCGKRTVRFAYAVYIHTALARAVSLQPLPYDVPPDVQQGMSRGLAPAGAPAASLADALVLLQADADAICACKDKACFMAATPKLTSDAIANEHLRGTQDQGAELRAITSRVHDCAVRLLGADAP